MTERDDGAPGWRVEHHHGTAAVLHALDWPDPLVPTVWVMEVAAPALVLGSTQPEVTVDAEALARWGITVSGRRSGGGAVLLTPTSAVWIDVLIPRRHHRWDDDVNRSFAWVGEAWASALGELGLDGEVHRGGLVRTPLSDRICFAGLGPGEVTVGGTKAVGLSQRRTSAGARFQSVVYQSWDPAPLAAVDGVDPALLPPVAVVTHPAPVIEAAFLRHLN